MVRARLIPLLVLAAAVGSEARAQSAGTNVLQNVPLAWKGQPGNEADGRSETTRGLLTPDALQGPPTPAVMYAVTGMDERQLGQYLAAYRAHMAATWNNRVAVMSALKMMGRASQSSDSDAVRYYRLLTDQLWRQLRTEDEGFDTALGAILTKGELRSYRVWQARWQRGAQAQQRLQVAAIQDRADLR